VKRARVASPESRIADYTSKRTIAHPAPVSIGCSACGGSGLAASSSL